MISRLSARGQVLTGNRDAPGGRLLPAFPAAARDGTDRGRHRPRPFRGGPRHARGTSRSLSGSATFTELVQPIYDLLVPRCPQTAPCVEARQCCRRCSSYIQAAPLAAAGIAGADKLLPATFLVIVGTVTVYGLTAAPVARILGLAETAEEARAEPDLPDEPRLTPPGAEE